MRLTTVTAPMTTITSKTAVITISTPTTARMATAAIARFVHPRGGGKVGDGSMSGKPEDVVTDRVGNNPGS